MAMAVVEGSIVGILDALTAPVGEKSGAIPLFLKMANESRRRPHFTGWGLMEADFFAWEVDGMTIDRSKLRMASSDIEISLVRVFVVVLTNGWA